MAFLGLGRRALRRADLRDGGLFVVRTAVMVGARKPARQAPPGGWTHEWVFADGTRKSHEDVLRMLAAQKQPRPKRRERSIRP